MRSIYYQAYIFLSVQASSILCQYFDRHGVPFNCALSVLFILTHLPTFYFYFYKKVSHFTIILGTNWWPRSGVNVECCWMMPLVVIKYNKNFQTRVAVEVESVHGTSHVSSRHLDNQLMYLFVFHCLSFTELRGNFIIRN